MLTDGDADRGIYDAARAKTIIPSSASDGSLAYNGYPVSGS